MAAGRGGPLDAAARRRADRDVEELAETVAWQLLLRWGVVFRDVYLKERLAVPWREILWALRRLEARGLIRGGHFVTGVTGEQFADETTGREVLDALRGRGALFHSELQAIAHRLPTEVEEGLWDGVARGLVTADGFNAVRSLLQARTRFARRQRPQRRQGSRGRRGTWRQGVEGRWTLLPAAEPTDEIEELAETVAWQLLLRWGVVFRDVYLKERLAVPWREILWALRRLEARGLIRGGHFVTGVTGEQFADETTAPLLRARRAA